MKDHGNREPSRGQQDESQSRSGAPSGFDGMNFEEQRGQYKNSDGAGGEQERASASRNGSSERNERGQ